MRHQVGSRKIAAGTRSAPALKGIKVLDLTQFEAGRRPRSAGLAGCELTKVEEPNPASPGAGAPAIAPTPIPLYSYYNLNKRSVTCNLKSEEGKALLRRMIVKADVLMENMAPGTFARLGFD